MDAEPFLFVVKYFLKSDPFFTLATRMLLPGCGKIFQLIVLLLAIWPSANFVLYELSRHLILALSATINAAERISVILHCLQKLLCRREDLFHKKYFRYYSRLRIISQSVDSEVKISMVLNLTSLGVLICGTTFVVVHLHEKYSAGMITIYGCVAVVFFMMLGILLNLFGRCDEMCRNFLRSCKNPVMLLGGMSLEERKVYLREVAALPRLILPVGVGQFRLIKLTDDNKARILFYIVDRIANVLIAFR